MACGGSSVDRTYICKAFFIIVWQFKHGCFPFFCRPLSLGECYTGQPACSIRPANHALAYICLYPCPLPFRKAPLRVALFKRNRRLLRFWAVNCWAHTYIAYCLSHSPSFCVHLNCVCRYQLQSLIFTERRLIPLMNVPWTPKPQKLELLNCQLRTAKDYSIYWHATININIYFFVYVLKNIVTSINEEVALFSVLPNFRGSREFS